jgi:hypothetical protein
MTAYMFQFELPVMTDEMAARVPEQRTRVAELFSEGRLVSYSLAQSRRLLWCVVMAETEQDALEMVASFPLHPYFTDVMYQPLMFHNTIASSLPDISLN